MGYYKNLMIDLMNKQSHGVEEDETAEEETAEEETAEEETAEEEDDFLKNAQADEPKIHPPALVKNRNFLFEF